MHYQTGEARMRRQRTKEVISLAMQGRWEEAVIANRGIIDIFPHDVGAYNRLGKALTELGRYREAKEAYSGTLEIDPKNAIARRNLRRLYLLEEMQPSLEGDPNGAVPHLFIEEMGKARVARLQQLAPREVLAKMAAGDLVYLRPEGQSRVVENRGGEYLGKVEPRIGSRLVKLIKGGNRYTAAITSLADNEVRVIIKEIFQHLSQQGRPSFPVKGRGDFRPYVRDSILKYELEEEQAFDDAGYPLEWEEETEQLPEGVSIVDDEADEERDDMVEEE